MYDQGEGEGLQYAAYSDVSPVGSANPISWKAFEYEYHEKETIWYIGLIVGTLVMGALFYWLSGTIWSLPALLVMAIAIFVYSNRKPQELQYSISEGLINVGSTKYIVDDFKSYSVVAKNSIQLHPLKRFMPFVTISTTDNTQNTVMAELDNYLPREPYNPDIFDKLMSKIRF